MDNMNIFVVLGICMILVTEYLMLERSKTAGLIIPAVFILNAFAEICELIWNVNSTYVLIYASAILSIVIVFVVRCRK